MPAEPSWLRIAADHYGLGRVRPMRHLRCFSSHYIVATDQCCYVLSQVERATDRIPFTHQFDILRALRKAGVTVVREPIPTENGAAYVETARHYWFMRDFHFADPVIWRHRPSLIAQAARTLAWIHVAGAHSDVVPVRHGGFDHGRLAPFYRTVEAFLDGVEDTYAGFDDRDLSVDDDALLRRTLDKLRADRGAVLRECRARGLTGITHHDYRPDNILVKDGRIIKVIDWDCAFTDHQMHDVAFAAFQFGQRQRLRDTDLQSVGIFLDAYLAARGLDGLPPSVTSWFLRFAVIKRLLINGSNAERMRLLRTLETAPRLASGRAGGRTDPGPGTARPLGRRRPVDVPVGRSAGVSTGRPVAVPVRGRA